jgi:hypothetical protein
MRTQRRDDGANGGRNEQLAVPGIVPVASKPGLNVLGETVLPTESFWILVQKRADWRRPFHFTL